MTEQETWDPYFFNRNLILAPLEAQARVLSAESAEPDKWPEAEAMNALWQQQHFSHNNRRLRFVTQTPEMEREALYYEQRIYQSGQIPTRAQNWHDLFNAIVWAQFPRSKAIMNQQHTDDIRQYGISPRSQRRNALTLFDECGVILACSEPMLAQLLREHQWQLAFWQHRAEWGRSIAPFVFGHALYEMALKPFIGLCGKAFFLSVDAAFFAMQRERQVAELDRRLAAELSNHNCLASNSRLSPFPILGVPGYDADNEQAEYYQNADYFRPKRRRGKLLPAAVRPLA